jgi:hypothetical protein
MKILKLSAAVALLSSSFNLFAAMPMYTLSDLGTLGDINSIVNDISSNGQFADHSNILSGISHASIINNNGEIIDEIHASPSLIELGSFILQNQIGDMTLTSDKSKFHLRPVEITPSDKQPGMYIDDNGNYELVTLDGNKISLFPNLEDTEGFADLLSRFKINVIKGTLGQLQIPFSDALSFSMRADIVSKLVNDDTPLGINISQHPQAAGIDIVDYVYMTARGKAQQFIFPQPIDWEALKTHLSDAGFEKVRLSANGIIEAVFEGMKYNAITDYKVIEGDSNIPAGIQFKQVENSNANSAIEFMIVYPDGKQQIITILDAK